jgi:hypothetical protein
MMVITTRNGLVFDIFISSDFIYLSHSMLVKRG